MVQNCHAYDAAENFGHQQSFHVLCREEKSRPASNECQAADDGIPVPEAFGNPAVDQQADKLANVGALGIFSSPGSSKRGSAKLTLLSPDCQAAETW
jgi:hypothetical protein